MHKMRVQVHLNLEAINTAFIANIGVNIPSCSGHNYLQLADSNILAIIKNTFSLVIN